MRDACMSNLYEQFVMIVMGKTEKERKKETERSPSAMQVICCSPIYKIPLGKLITTSNN